MRDLLSHPTSRYVIKLLTLGAVYAAVAYISLYLVPPGGSGASLVWPTAAVGLAGLYLFGLELWPALLLPFVVLLVTRGVPIPTAMGVALGNTLESMVGAYVLRTMSFRPLLNRLGDVFTFLLASAVATAVSASVIAGTLYMFGATPGQLNTPLWVGLWIGHVVSLGSFGPFLLRWLAEPRFTLSRRELLEGVLAIGTVVVFSFLTSWTNFTSIGSISFFYIIIIGLIWSALRTGSRGTSLALMLFGLIIATGLLYGWGSGAHAANPTQTLLGVQVFVGVFSLIFLLFAAVTEERREAIKRLEEHVGQLEVSLERISTEDQAKTDFIAILAHELRNPLSPILSSLELMKQNGIKEGDERHVASISSNLHIMARLLDDLLDISRITQKKFKIQLEPVELKTIIDQTLEIVHPYLDSRTHTFKTDMPSEPVWLSADPVRLTQVFVNILNNAGKYTEPGGTITLQARAQNGIATITITDNGIGIEPSRISKIFDSFGGAEGPARRPGGLHIGLSLAKRMVELHHGTITSRSLGTGRGSQFIVTLPMLPTAPLAMDTPRRRLRSRFSKDALDQARRAGPLRVLIVDDNEAAAQSLAELLSKGGRRTSTASTAVEGLAEADRLRPDVALLDIGLPDIDGYQLCRQLRARFNGDIKLVALTGYGQPEDRQKARDAGFDEHVVKPVAIVDLERMLGELTS